MQRRLIAVALALAAASAPVPARACMADSPLDLSDVQYANAVVIGRIANYQIVADRAIRRELGLARHAPPGRLMPDYARFDVIVDEVLLGNVGRSVRVTWDNSTFPEPDSMPAGPYLIALRARGSPTPPLRGPSATTSPSREPALPTVLQAPCSAPFIFEQASKEAQGVRRILERRSR